MRMRDVLAVLAGLAVVGAVGYGGWLFLADTMDPVEAAPEPGDDAGATADAYLAAWAAEDLPRMQELVREPPEDFAERHRQLTAALSPTELRVTGGELDDVVDGRATVPVTVELDLADIEDPIAWDTELVLLRERGTWAVDWSMSTIHPELRPTWVFARATVPVEREPIVASDGTALAGGSPSVTFGFAAGEVTDPEAVIEAFATAIPGSEVAAERELSRDDLNPDWFYPVVTVSEARADLAAPELRVSLGILQRAAPPSTRTLLDPGFARHVVGVVSEATAEQLEELGPDVEVGTRVAQFGLEAVFDDQLSGSDIIQVGLRDQGEENAPLRVVIGEGQVDPSEPVETTLDVAVQRAVEATLGGVEGPAAIVVVDGEDGAIRGSASRPLGGFNRAFSGRYPPGSTFKLITAEALLGSGTTLDDTVACPAETTVGGLRVPNSGDRDLGNVPFATAFDASCNTTFATLGAALGADALAEAAERFGFGTEPLVPLTAFGGSFPEPADTAETGAAAFGQARVETSPLHLASVAAATVTGIWHQPYLLVEDGPGTSNPLATGTPALLRSLLRTAVTEGTGSAADVAGQEVGGKTGTAQSQDGVEHAWFIGTWEGLGFAVLIEDGGAGGEVAAPIAGRLVEQLVASSTTGDAEPGPPAATDGTDDGGDTATDGPADDLDDEAAASDG